MISRSEIEFRLISDHDKKLVANFKCYEKELESFLIEDILILYN